MLNTEMRNPNSTHIDKMSSLEMAKVIQAENLNAALAVEKVLPQIAEVIDRISERINKGGRLFYVGCGTSGRLGILDASECPPTFGVDNTLVMGVIAGGDYALRNAVENAEDKPELGEAALKELNVNEKDCVVGISASGYAPYCVGGLTYARSVGALTLALACNENTIISGYADIAIEMPTGPEILSGSTRLKAGTATKLALNMLSTLTMVQLGKVYRNLMVDMKPSNIKLQDRSVRIVQKALNVEREEAEKLYLAADKNTKAAIVMGTVNVEKDAAVQALKENDGFIRRAIEALK